jgi:cold-inducible RNA-binding protein
MNIYIGNLNFKISEDQIRSIFADYGDVSNVKIIRDRETSRSKGFGFVEMPNASEGAAAISGLNQKEVMGRPMIVNEARPQQARD